MAEASGERTPYSDAPIPDDATGSQGTARPPARRIVGLDLARFLAVFWMFVAHIGPDRNADGINRLLWLGDGREAALFAFLAGVSLTFAYGRTPHRSAAATRFWGKTIVRSVALFVLGVLLASIDTGILVILPFFAVYFVFALPAVHLRARSLALWAAGLALVGPQVSFVLRAASDPNFDHRVPELHTLSSPDQVASALLLTGTYPVATWMAFVFAGMAVESGHRTRS
jgi:uncharacterized membrane protein